ncbi:MAG: YhbY family RNA-binding protein [Clostridia bacterium]|jgi:RNA-binding protein|nr:YhbY family RNA-binding protein [Clostridia bacterium]
MLTSKQRASLRKMAHALQPIIYVGKAGVTDNIITQTDDALPVHELIKGTVQQSCPVSAKDAMNEIAARVGAEAVSTSGRKFIIYRANPDEPIIKI